MGEQLAIDYAWQHPDPAAIRAAGYTAVLRYLSADPSKDITPDEAAALGAQQLGVGVIWETTARAAMGSTVAGQQDGATVMQRLAALGAPAGTPVLANLGDWQVQAAEVPAIHAYYSAFRAQLGAYVSGAGGYGPGGLIDQLARYWPDDIWWQNGIDALGWLGSKVHPSASIYQRTVPTRALTAVQGSYDEDVYGIGPRQTLGWWRSGVVTAPPPLPEVTDMQVPPTVQQGSTGPEVRNAQALLVGRGYRLGNTGQFNTGIDGEFGPLTNAAVHEYQQYVSIAADGIVGPVTWGKLLGSV